MSRTILSVNAGSSSVKVSVYTHSPPSKEPTQLALIQIDGLTAPPPTLTSTHGDKHIKGQKLDDITSQDDAFRYIMDHLERENVADRNSIAFVTHRVVHGGDYPRAQVIDRDTYHRIEELSDLAPLHNAGALALVRAAHAQLPSATNVAYFDSSFHSTIPRHIATYPISPKVAGRNKLRKYGFHGLSYGFIVKAVGKALEKPVEELNLIALHLGSGASACAIKGGKSWDTSMGLTPLAGLPGATRSGSVDPSLVFHYTHDVGKLSTAGSGDMHITRAEQILNKESGWSAIAGTTDFGEISARAEKGSDEGAELAFDMFVDRIVGYVGSYYLTLRGKVDALVFAGGIGEKGSRLRAKVVESAACLGFAIDEQANGGPRDQGVVSDISASGTKHKVLICKTDEQLEMARHCIEEAETFSKEAKDGD